ncbi:MAG TPA: hypothetical protein VEL51_05850 [Vicinamibacterales bacterium]|nr:hypothetical protein [Vicinamibacterales bacterium]
MFTMKPVLAVWFMFSAASSFAQTHGEDEYARYELLAPETAGYRLTYDVTAGTVGAKSFAVAIAGEDRPSDVSVIDILTGRPLKFAIASNSIRIDLARPVPEGGETRLRIVETFKDPKSYSRDGDTLVFKRTVDVKRNAVVLPGNYELVAANVPVQVIEEADGRIAASFMNLYPVEAPLVIKARPVAARPTSSAAPPAAAPTPPMADAPSREQAMNLIRVTERALQDREIVYFLKEPETHAFSLYHDYTASREGEHQYVNVVRTGSTVSEPSARILDTGEVLKTRVLTGADVAREKIDIPDRVDPDTQLVLIPFTPVAKGTSVRLRISETYTDPTRYALVDGQLMWHRSFGRPRNDMVLPAGWYLTTSSIPAVISQDLDGRIRLSFSNPRPDNVDVFVKGRKR